MKSHESSPVLVVGIGASAGGLDALRRFFITVPENSPIAFIVVQHLDPKHESIMADILSRQTPFSFCQAQDDQTIEAGMAYVIPPNAYMEVVDNTIKIIEPQHQRGSRLSIDHLFRSLSEEYKSKAVGLILSGSGSDGTAGLRALKAMGGLSVAQTPKQAEYPSMPRSAIDAGVVDQVMDVEDIYTLLLEYAEHPYHDLGDKNKRAENEEEQKAIRSLLKTQENFDLDQYKQTTVQRRLFRRMSLTSKPNPKEYIKLLNESLEERQLLMRDLYINVTDFFRDQAAFKIINEKVIHNIVNEVHYGSDIRVWVVGCASGEEAYTMAILFMEKIKLSGKKLGLKIFATDVDEEVLQIARKGIYPESITSELPKEYLETYFTEHGNGYYSVNSNIRDCISFANQNVCSDPPFSKMHLVSCRNLLIYFRSEIQQKVLRTFHFSLLPGGYLFLGSSESLGEQRELFAPISQKWRIFSRVGHSSSRSSSQISTFSKSTNKNIKSILDTHRKGSNLSPTDKSKISLLVALNPSVLLDQNNKVVYFHGNLDPYLKFPMGDAELNFLNMLDPELRISVKNGINKAKKVGKVVLVKPPRRYKPNNNKQLFNAKVSPNIDTDGSISSLVISFEDIEIDHHASTSTTELIPPKDQKAIIDALESELLETKEELKNTSDELETCNEALRTTHEEALTTHEELQASNEELEASSEELRSLNAELVSVNVQLKEKIDELSNTHSDIKNFLASTNLATLFLSSDLKLKRCTPAAERLLNIGPQDIEKPLSSLSRDFIDKQTLKDAALMLESLEPKEKELEVNGQWFTLRILPYTTEDRRIEGVVLTFNEITHLKKAMRSFEASSKQHAVIAELGLKALSSNDMSSFMDQLVREVAFTLNADLSKVLKFIPEQNTLLLKAGVGFDKDLIGKATVSADVSTQAGYTLQSRKAVVVENLSEEQRFTSISLLSNQHVVSSMSCIIEGVEHPYGILAVHSVNKRQFNSDDANFLVSAAHILSVAINRRKMEEKLIDSEERLRVAKDSNKMGSFLHDMTSGECSWDQLLLDIWGLNSNPVKIEEFYQGLHPDDYEHVISALNAAKDPIGDGHYKAIYRVINKKSKLVTWIEATGQVEFDDGKAQQMIGMVIDVTEKMELEHSLKSAVRQLQGTNEKQNEFIATLGHEIRNPLAAIASGVQIIEQDKAQLDHAVHIIHNNVNIVSSLLDDLLDLTRIARGQITLKKQTINFSNLISDIHQSFLVLCEEKEQKITLKLPPEDIIAWVDKTRLHQSITNIVSNAHKFTPKGGSIAIELRQVENHLEVEIKDNGIGLDMQHKETIFEPFQQLKQKHSVDNPGMGIGLSLVKQFVALHDGNVSIESDGPNTGTTFKLSIPIIGQPSISAIEPEPKQDSSAVISNETKPNNLSILLVDDNEDAAYGLSLILNIKGYQVQTCYTGSAAIAELKNFQPDVLILDIGLPDMTGYELLKAIKLESSTPMLSIALTGFGHKEARESSKEAGFDHHMTKPVSIDKLVQILASHIK